MHFSGAAAVQSGDIRLDTQHSLSDRTRPCLLAVRPSVSLAGGCRSQPPCRVSADRVTCSAHTPLGRGRSRSYLFSEALFDQSCESQDAVPHRPCGIGMTQFSMRVMKVWNDE